MNIPSAELLVGGLVAGTAGALIASAKNLPSELGKFIRKQFTVTVNVASGDKLFEWVQSWFDEQESIQRTRRLSVSSGQNIGSLSPLPIGGAQRVKFTAKYSPAPGKHIMRLNGKKILVDRVRKDVSGSNGDYRGYVETFELTVIGRKQDFIRDTITKVLETAALSSKEKTSIYVSGMWDGWMKFADNTARPPESVVMREGVKEALIADIERFVVSKKRYDELGVPYHRGYLFHGPPGCGKSSAIFMLAGLIERDVYVINMAGMKEAAFMAQVCQVPAGAIMLFEDIDCCYDLREKASDDVGVNFATFLNVLDGAGAKSGSIEFMTTNRIEKLDDALIRPGRIDYIVEFDLATADMAKRMYERFYPGADGTAFGLEWAGKPMAEIQEQLVKEVIN